jgi:hypothetical protein
MINGASIRNGGVAGLVRSRIIEPPLADPKYLDRLAARLAAAARLPLETARQRVEALAISARPRSHGFQDRCR